ncbi:zinc metalloproteinase nas-39-like [Strongylocentrotus purpuratus]|uniref:CUB domain-containing protein n=1 Tax=Strongylocentrotus purpuratus TaxID=7668 RepID=A0A7M7N718_STRPU|nr:zinc metalloproteinase nas-39-like [Strongylocentrotus purpuratus]
MNSFSSSIARSIWIVSILLLSQSDLSNGTEVDTFGFGESLTIVSPNYPNNYPNNVNTQWLVSGPADYQIMAVFSTFDLEDFLDILRIGSGLDPDDTASLLATLSGSSLPGIIVSNSKEMWLAFKSDVSNTELGFRMNIEVYTPGNYTDNMTASSSSRDNTFISSSAGKNRILIMNL